MILLNVMVVVWTLTIFGIVRYVIHHVVSIVKKNVDVMMKFDISVYSKHFEMIEKLYAEKSERTFTEICVSSQYPLIMVYTVINRKFGGFESEIENLMKFYGYTEIVG